MAASSGLRGYACAATASKLRVQTVCRYSHSATTNQEHIAVLDHIVSSQERSPKELETASDE